MKFERVERWVLKTLDRIALAIVWPFSEATSLNQYADRGFVLLGGLLSAATALLWSSGFLRTPIAESPDWVQIIYAWTVAYLPFLPQDGSRASLALIPGGLYVIAVPFANVRRYVGETVVDFIGKVGGLFIVSGEWCLEHRWSSVAIVVALAGTAAFAIDRQIDTVTRRNLAESNLSYWLNGVESFVDESTMARAEDARYREVRSRWNTEFVAFLSDRDRSHPALCVHQMLELLYGEREDRPWQDVLRLKLGSLRQASMPCGRWVHDDKTDDLSERSYASMNVLLGRVFARLGNGDHSTSLMKEAYETFKTVQTEITMHLSGPQYRHYTSSATNGLGTVYRIVLMHSLNPAELSDADTSVMREICRNAVDCAVQALEAYRAGGDGYEECSFQGRRSLNNTVDLLASMGVDYDAIRKADAARATANWRNPGDLAADLQKALRRLLGCSGAEPIIPAMFITAAQSYGVIASLLDREKKPWREYAEAAANQLRIASAFDASNVPTWAVSYICPAFRHAGGRGVFRNILARDDGFGHGHAVLDRLSAQCL